MNDSNARQQIVEKIKDSSNILVTVSTNPSVDELSAALGLTLLLNKMNKHATAVFSGAVPPAITFLDPEKTFENTVDSLRDFIIALDKEKADHLRYKVDGDVVKIFITPYRTTITGDDLDFSQGDYNVELVLALGVKNRDNLDQALAAHGRILHDASVVSIGVGDDQSDLGSINWRESTVSSLSEMLVGLSESLKSDKTLLDEQIATAFLTGIVAATDRFSNNLTSSRVMTMAAQLMAAGANQQLIAAKLQEAHAIGSDTDDSGDSSDGGDSQSQNSDGTTDLAEGESTKLKKGRARKSDQPPAKPPKDDGSLSISHEKVGDLDAVAQATQAEAQADATQAAEAELAKQPQPPAESANPAVEAAEQNLADQLADVAPAAANPAAVNTPSVADLQKDIAAANSDLEQAAADVNAPTPPLSGAVPPGAWQSATPTDDEPQFGGTLNATTEQAADDERKLLEDDRNRTILSHGDSEYIGNNTPLTYQSPLNAATQPDNDSPVVDPFGSRQSGQPTDTQATAHAPALQPLDTVPTPLPAETLADLDKQTRGSEAHDEALADVHAAFGAVPYAPPVSAEPVNVFDAPAPAPAPAPAAPTIPPLPDYTTLPPLPPAPDFETLAPQASAEPDKLGDILTPAPAPVPPPATSDPGQFRIPGSSS